VQAGLGPAVAERMVAQGARVLITDRGEMELRGVIDEIGARGEIEAITAHLSGPTGLQRMFDRVDEWLGGLDILVACAGVGSGPLMETPAGAMSSRATSSATSPAPRARSTGSKQGAARME